MNQENRSDPMVEIFPRITKCTFHKYGASGSIQKHDALCVLALNILNEKIYIFLWFWFILLAVLSACAIIYSALVVMLPTTREAIIKRRFRNGTTNEVEGLISNIQVKEMKIILFYFILFWAFKWNFSNRFCLGFILGRLETFCYFTCSAKISVWMHLRIYYVSYAIVWVHRHHRHHHPWKWHMKWHHSTVRHLKMKKKRWHSKTGTTNC